MAEPSDGVVLRKLRVRTVRDAGERAAWGRIGGQAGGGLGGDGVGGVRGPPDVGAVGGPLGAAGAGIAGVLELSPSLAEP